MEFRHPSAARVRRERRVPAAKGARPIDMKGRVELIAVGNCRLRRLDSPNRSHSKHVISPCETPRCRCAPYGRVRSTVLLPRRNLSVEHIVETRRIAKLRITTCESPTANYLSCRREARLIFSFVSFPFLSYFYPSVVENRGHIKRKIGPVRASPTFYISNKSISGGLLSGRCSTSSDESASGT